MQSVSFESPDNKPLLMLFLCLVHSTASLLRHVIFLDIEVKGPFWLSIAVYALYQESFYSVKFFPVNDILTFFFEKMQNSKIPETRRILQGKLIQHWQVGG